MGLAVMVELPLVVIDVQRAGPSTGMPTKNEQADLLQVMFGRNSDSPVPDRRAGHARRVLRLRDRGLAARAQVHDPGRLPVGRVPGDRLRAVARPGARGPARHRASTNATDPATFRPYERDPETLARPWAVPGTPGLEHRIGGLEKADITGNVSYDPDNHHRMQLCRQAKVAGIADDIPPLEVFGPERGDLLILGWGSTYGAIRSAVERLQAEGKSVAHAHLRHLNPFPANTEDVLRQLPPGAHPGGQPRPAAAAHPGALPRRRGRLRPGPRQAVPRSPRS